MLPSIFSAARSLANVAVREQVAALIARPGISPSSSKLGQFVCDRLRLLNGAANAEVGLWAFGSKIHHDFFGPACYTKPSIFGAPVVCDDVEIYSQLLGHCWSASKRGMDDYDSIVAEAAFRVVHNYFGPVTNSGASSYLQIHREYDGEVPLSIATFKGKGMAHCGERAMTLQNLLSFAGMDVTFLIGHTKLPQNADEELHAFNVFYSGQHGYSLLDSSSYTVNVNGQQLVASLAVYPLTETELERLSNGVPIEVEHRNFRYDGGMYLSAVDRRQYRLWRLGS